MLLLWKGIIWAGFSVFDSTSTHFKSVKKDCKWLRNKFIWWHFADDHTMHRAECILKVISYDSSYVVAMSFLFFFSFFKIASQMQAANLIAFVWLCSSSFIYFIHNVTLVWTEQQQIIRARIHIYTNIQKHKYIHRSKHNTRTFTCNEWSRQSSTHIALNSNNILRAFVNNK